MPKYREISIHDHTVLLIGNSEITKLIEKAEIQSRLKAENVHPDDPSGKKRMDEEISSQNFLGILAEIICEEILKSYFRKYNVQADVIRYDDIREDNFKNHDLFDIKLSNGDYEKLIEVRSSVCCYLSLEDMISKWQILGPYQSEVKGVSEIEKPFYMRLLYHVIDYEKNRKDHFYNRASGIEHLKKNNLMICFVGGATTELLEKHGRYTEQTEFKQGKTIFKVVDILHGLDAKELLQAIAEDIQNDMHEANK